MINSFKDIINNDNIIQILSLIVTILIAYITAKLTLKNTKKSITAEHFKQKGIEIQERNLQFWCSILTISYDKAMLDYVEKRNKNSSDKIQIKFQNNQGQKKISKEDQNKIIKIIQTESYIYSSKTTIKAIRSYLQYSYKLKEDNKSDDELINENNKANNELTNENKKNSVLFQQVKALTLPARIMSCMKNDFTGEKVDALEILKIKITDWDLKRELIARLWLLYYYFKERYFIFIILILLILLIIVVLVISLIF